MNEKFNLKINTDKIKNIAINYIVPLICFGLTAVLGLFVIYPMFKAWPTLKSDALSKEELAGVLQEKVSALERLVDFEKVVSEDSELINKVLVSKDAVPQLLNQVDSIARAAGFEIERLSYSYGETTEKKAFDTVTVSLAVSGSYDQLIAFSRDIENAARLVDILDFRYTTNDSDGKLNVTFVLSSPYLAVSSNAVTDDPMRLDISDTKFIEFINRVKKMKFYESITNVSESSESGES